MMGSIYETLIITFGVILTQVLIAWRMNNVMKFRLDIIEKKQDKHNSFMERLTIAEVKLENLEREVQK
jgi:hypothetical protein